MSGAILAAMALLIPNPRDDNSLSKEQAAAPPLFAGLLRAERIQQDFDNTFQEALTELADERFVASLGKFREALVLSRGQELLEGKLRDGAISEAAKLIERNWRVAEALVVEVAQAPDILRADIEQRRREETIQAALEESVGSEHAEYLPPIRERLARLLDAYPRDARLETRLRLLDGLLAAQASAEREKNLRRLSLFRDRLQAADNPDTLRRFRALAAPFANPYHDDPEFAAILDDAAGLWSAYENARTLLAEGRSRESIQACEQVLERKPSNTLFRWLREKAKAREWVAVLADSTMQRAQEFAKERRYPAALEELESLRSIDPVYPGLRSETLRYQALLTGSDSALAPVLDMTPKTAEEESILGSPPADLVPLPVLGNSRKTGTVSAAPPEALTIAHSGGLKIVITENAWNHLKTGLVATFALLMVVLLLASNLHK